MTEQHAEPARIRVQTAAALALGMTVLGMLLGYEVARLDHDKGLAQLWTRSKEDDDGRSR
jgi:hypothetical protein